MKIRLYHSEIKKDKEAVDAWSIYCPYPKKYRIPTSIKGVFLGCKPTENGMVRCCWTEDEVGNKVYLGNRIDVSSTPKAFQAIFNHIARVFKNACEKDTKEAWDEFAKV